LVTRNELISGLSWNTLTVVLQVVIQLVYTGLLARIISPDSFALMGIVLGIMGFAEIFSQVGIGPALIQRKEVHQQHINGAFYTAIILGLIFFLVFVLCAPAIASVYGIPELELIVQVVCSSFIISALAVVPRSMLMKEMRFKIFFRASMISIVGGNLIVGLLLAYLEYNLWAYVWALFAQNVLMTLALWYYQPTKITRIWKWKFTRELIRYGSGSTLFNALNYLATKLDVLLVPFFLRGQLPVMTLTQKESAAMYERSNYAMTQPITVMGKLSDSVLFSGMSKMQDEDARLRKMMRVATTLLSVIIVPTTIFIIFFSGEIIRVWLGSKFMEAVPILQVLFIAVIFRVLSKLGDSLLRAKDAVFRGAWIKAVYVVLIGTGIFFSTEHGMIYVAASVVVATFIHYLMNMFLCTQLIGLKWMDLLLALAPSIGLGLVVSTIAWITSSVSEAMNLPAVVSLLTGLLAIGSCVVILIYSWPQLLGKREDNMLNFLPNRLKSFTLIQRMLARL